MLGIADMLDSRHAGIAGMLGLQACRDSGHAGSAGSHSSLCSH